MGQEGRHSQLPEEYAEASGDPACHWHAQNPCSVFLDSLSGPLLPVQAVIPEHPRLYCGVFTHDRPSSPSLGHRA